MDPKDKIIDDLRAQLKILENENLMLTGRVDELTEMNKPGGTTSNVQDPDELLNQLQGINKILKAEIKKREETEHKLEMSEEKFRMIFNNANDAIILWKALPDGLPEYCLEVNKVYTEMTGFTEEEMKGKAPDDFSGKELIPRLNLLQEKDMIKYERSLKTKSGNDIPTELSARSFMLRGMYVTLAVHRDISRRKKFENLIIQEKIKAEESDRLKSVFLANMSHEIRTPMNAIMGFSELLHSEDLTEEEKHTYLDILRGKGKDLLSLINDILYISKIEANQIAITPEVLSIGDYLKKEELNWSNMIPENKKNSVRFELHISFLFELNIMIDTLRLSQVLNNLISNAIKFTDAGKIILMCKVEDKDIYFEVEDTGIGIPEDKHEMIFGRFRQADEGQTRKYGGTGLGLSICAQLVELMDGKIGVQSEPGKGSKFWFKIPLVIP